MDTWNFLDLGCIALRFVHSTSRLIGAMIGPLLPPASTHMLQTSHDSWCNDSFCTLAPASSLDTIGFQSGRVLTFVSGGIVDLQPTALSSCGNKSRNEVKLERILAPGPVSQGFPSCGTDGAAAFLVLNLRPGTSVGSSREWNAHAASANAMVRTKALIGPRLYASGEADLDDREIQGEWR